MKCLPLAFLLAACSSIACGQEPADRGYQIIAGRIHLIGKFANFAGIEATSRGNHLSVDEMEFPGGGKLPAKLPFDHQGVYVVNNPGQVVLGVLGAANRLSLNGATPTSIRYAGDNAKADLTIMVGVEDGKLVQLSLLAKPKPQVPPMPAHVVAAFGQLVGDWEVQTVEDGVASKADLQIEWAIEGAVLRFHRVDTGGPREPAVARFGFLGWDAARKVITEREVGANGTTTEGTHQIAQDGQWTSRMRGTQVVDGKPVYFEAQHAIYFKSADEWVIAATNRVRDGVNRPNVTSTVHRK